MQDLQMLTEISRVVLMTAKTGDFVGIRIYKVFASWPLIATCKQLSHFSDFNVWQFDREAQKQYIKTVVMSRGLAMFELKTTKWQQGMRLEYHHECLTLISPKMKHKTWSITKQATKSVNIAPNSVLRNWNQY